MILIGFPKDSAHRHDIADENSIDVSITERVEIMTRLLLVRHGETDWNRQHRYQGQIDIHLNSLGRRQVAAVSQRLASEKIEALYASDLNRAWKTAAVISTQHDGLEIVKDFAFTRNALW